MYDKNAMRLAKFINLNRRSVLKEAGYLRMRNEGDPRKAISLSIPTRLYDQMRLIADKNNTSISKITEVIYSKMCK